ncbi:MAG: EamA family transporter [Rhodothermaceae bacterium]
MLNLLLTIICSTSIALILKHNDSKKGNPVVLLMGNYFVASLLGFFFMLKSGKISFSTEVLIFGAFMGGVFFLSFFLFTKGVNIAGAALSTVSSRLSVIIPIFLSIIFFNEIPGLTQIIGFLFAVATIVLFYFSLKTISQEQLTFSEYFILFTLLAGIGIGDFGMKIFNQWKSSVDQPFFLFSIFSFAFLYTLIYVLVKKEKIELITLKRGAVLGIPNIFSSYFLLEALNQIPAIIVYPVANIGIILATTSGALFFWKEKLNKFGKIALVSGITSILFLSL